jgi:hypothetical protein
MFRGRIFDKWKKYNPQDKSQNAEFQFIMITGSGRFLKGIPTSPNGQEIEVIQFRKWCRLDIEIARLLADYEDKPLLVILDDCQTDENEQCNQEALKTFLHFESEQWVIFSCDSTLSELQKQMLPVILTDWFNQLD